MGAPSLPVMTSQRPYLLRALYQWIEDNDMTPHVVVNARVPGVRVPPHTVKDGQVVLNIAQRAVARLEMGDDILSFSARFGGVSQHVVVPVDAVMAIYASETGQGMVLPQESAPTSEPSGVAAEPAAPAAPAVATEQPQPAPGDDDHPPSPPKRGHLRIVK